MSERARLSDYILLSTEVVSSQGRSGLNFLVHLCYKPSGGLWVRADQRRAAGAAPVCCGATPVDEAVGCTGVRAAVLHGVLIFAGATGAVDITADCECAGGAPGHSGVAGATLPGEEFFCMRLCFFTASGCLSRMWSWAHQYVPPPTTLIK